MTIPAPGDGLRHQCHRTRHLSRTVGSHRRRPVDRRRTEVHRTSAAAALPPEAQATRARHQPTTRVRFFAVDGSVFLDSDYLIRGVAGRVLWSLLQRHVTDGRCEFTTKEIRLDTTLELPSYRDNLDSRLVLLSRRLQDSDAPVRLERSGRGRVRLHLLGPLHLVQER